MYEPVHSELVNLMRNIPEQLRGLNDATANSCSQRVSNDINKDLKTMQANLLKTLKENIKMEVCQFQRDFSFKYFLAFATKIRMNFLCSFFMF